jgi:hypothetical protein
MRLLRLFRCFSRLKITFILICFLPVVTALHSCSEYDFEGSMDIDDEKEGGPSQNVNSDDLGFNLAAAILTSLPQNTTGHGDAIGNKAIYSDAGAEYIPAKSNGGFALSSKLEFIKKGSKFQQSHTHLSYLNIVEDVVYQYKMADNSNIMGGLGPYIGYGIGGNVSGGGFSESAFGGQDGYKRFDAGISLMGRYQLPSSLYFGLDYQFGLVNKSPAPDFTSRNRSLSINVGYSLDKIFGNIRKK